MVVWGVVVDDCAKQNVANSRQNKVKLSLGFMVVSLEIIDYWGVFT